MNHRINQPLGKPDANDLKSIQHIIRKFCSAHDAHDVQLILWDMLKLALCSAEASNWDEDKRADYIFAYEGLAQLVEAIFARTDQWEKGLD